jgi:hypothetical protein
MDSFGHLVMRVHAEHALCALYVQQLRTADVLEYTNHAVSKRGHYLHNLGTMGLQLGHLSYSFEFVINIGCIKTI